MDNIYTSLVILHYFGLLIDWMIFIEDFILKHEEIEIGNNLEVNKKILEIHPWSVFIHIHSNVSYIIYSKMHLFNKY